MRFSFLAATVAGLLATTVARRLPSNISAGIDTLQLQIPARLAARGSRESQVLADPASDEVWNKAVGKGRGMDCAMRGTDREAGWQLGERRNPLSAASPWTGGTAEVKKWFWHYNEVTGEHCDMDIFGMGDTFGKLQLSPEPPNLQCFKLRHFTPEDPDSDGSPDSIKSQTYNVEGRTYKATGASNLIAMDINHGVIVGNAIFGPEYSAKRIYGQQLGSDDLPKLRALSDLYWAYWIDFHEKASMKNTINNLNMYIVNDVHNEDTDSIITRALRSRQKRRMQKWPGQYFEAQTPEGFALIGSPLGATIAYLLMQHKKDLGHKYIKGVRVLKNEDIGLTVAHRADLVFDIADYPPDEEMPDAPQNPDTEMPDVPPHQLRYYRRESKPADDAPHSVLEEILGPNNVLRTHTFISREWT